MFDVLHENCPTYLSSLFNKRSSDTDNYKSKLRGNDHIEVRHIPKTDFFRNSFYYRGAKMWNSLPSEIKAAPTKNIFKERLIKWRTVSAQ